MSRYLWLASALFIVYGTSLPFDFVADPAFAARKLSRLPVTLGVPGASRWGLPDMVQNVLLFVPFGVFGAIAIGRRARLLASALIVAGLGLALSVGVEALQLFTTNRSSSLNDVVMNTVGAVMGALAAPAAATGFRQAMALARARGLGRTADSLYPLVIAAALLALATWHPFDVALNPGGMWSDVKRLLADPLQAGVFRDEGADALRYGLFGAAAVMWLRAAGFGHPALLAGAIATAGAAVLEASQIVLMSRSPGLKDVLVGTSGGWAGALAAASPIGRWPSWRLAVLVVLLAWGAAAVLTLAPFDWGPARRPFHWLPMASYYRNEPDTTISNVIEIALAFVPLGFALGRVVRRRAVWTAFGLSALLMWPLEYLQGWTVDRVPDVSGILVAALGGALGAWMAGPVRERFCADLSSTRGSPPPYGLAIVAVALLGFTGVNAQERDRSKPVSFAILEDYDKGDPLAEIEADFRLMQSLEIDTWRGSIGWDDYEPARGRYDFEWLHTFVELAAEYNLTLRPYLGYTPEWAAREGGHDAVAWNNPPAALEDWDAFASAAAAALRRHDHVESFEIYNEENVAQWWDGTAAEYGDVLTRGGRAIRSRNPSAAIVFGGLVFPDIEWVEAVCGLPGAGAAFDVLPVHAYPETWTPEAVTVENYLGGLDAFVAAADLACGRKRIWINETGYATVPGRSERDQAIWWVRAVATFLAQPRVEHIGIYEIKDLAPDRPAIGDAPNYHLGLTRTDRTRKLAFHTIDLLTDLLDTGTLTVDDEHLAVKVVSGSAGELHHHLFTRPDGDKVLIVWDRLGAPALAIDVPNVSGSIEYDIDGRALNWDAAGTALNDVRLAPGVPRIFKLLR